MILNFKQHVLEFAETQLQSEVDGNAASGSQTQSQIELVGGEMSRGPKLLQSTLPFPT